MTKQKLKSVMKKEITGPNTEQKIPQLMHEVLKTVGV